MNVLHKLPGEQSNQSTPDGSLKTEAKDKAPQAKTSSNSNEELIKVLRDIDVKDPNISKNPELIEKIFNLKPGFNKEELNHAYRSTARKVHPDKTGGDAVPFQNLQAFKESLEKSLDNSVQNDNHASATNQSTENNKTEPTDSSWFENRDEKESSNHSELNENYSSLKPTQTVFINEEKGVKKETKTDELLLLLLQLMEKLKKEEQSTLRMFLLKMIITLLMMLEELKKELHSKFVHDLNSKPLLAIQAKLNIINKEIATLERFAGALKNINESSLVSEEKYKQITKGIEEIKNSSIGKELSLLKNDCTTLNSNTNDDAMRNESKETLEKIGTMSDRFKKVTETVNKCESTCKAIVPSTQPFKPKVSENSKKDTSTAETDVSNDDVPSFRVRK